MKEIQLTQGKVALVDDDVYEWAVKLKWQAHYEGNVWYATRSVKLPRPALLRMHRMILSAPDGVPVDHINRNGLDNRRENLRLCTQSENMANRGPEKDNALGLKGVSWDKVNKKWRAQIRWHGKSKAIGRYNSPEEAARAYDAAARELHGEFAWTNYE